MPRVTTFLLLSLLILATYCFPDDLANNTVSGPRALQVFSSHHFDPLGLISRQPCLVQCSDTSCCNTGGPCVPGGGCCGAGQEPCPNAPGCCPIGTCGIENGQPICNDACIAPIVLCSNGNCCDAGQACSVSAGVIICITEEPNPSPTITISTTTPPLNPTTLSLPSSDTSSSSVISPTIITASQENSTTPSSTETASPTNGSTAVNSETTTAAGPQESSPGTATKSASKTTVFPTSSPSTSSVIVATSAGVANRHVLRAGICFGVFVLMIL